MQDFTGLHLKPKKLARYGLPDIPYPLSMADLSAAPDDEKLPPHRLQQRSRRVQAQWQQLEAGPVDLGARLVSSKAAMRMKSLRPYRPQGKNFRHQNHRPGAAGASKHARPRSAFWAVCWVVRWAMHWAHPSSS